MCCHKYDEQFSFRRLVCNHIDILSISCHECFGFYPFGVATNISKICSFLCIVCTHDDILNILYCVFLPNSSLIASKMITSCSFQCLVCNNDHMVQNEIAIIAFSHFHDVFVFPHFEDVSRNCLHIDLAYALPFTYLCCAMV